MKTNLILLVVFLNVLSNAYTYKLRRDIVKLRQYCKEICRSCGGEAAVEADFCICNIEDESEEVQHCLEKAKNKFDFLGIKWEKNRSQNLKKRSIHKPDQSSFVDRNPDSYDTVSEQPKETATQYHEQDEHKTAVLSDIGDKTIVSRRRRITEFQNTLPQSIPIRPDLEQNEQNKRPRRSVNFPTDFMMDYYGTKLFHPVLRYRKHEPAPFKFLLGSAMNYNADDNMLYDFLESADEEKSGYDGANTSSEDLDYNNEASCEDTYIGRLLTNPFNRLNIYFSA